MSGLTIGHGAALDEALRAQAAARFGALPFGERTVDWCEMLQRARVPGLEVHYLPATRGGELRGLGVLHVVRGLDLADYVGGPVRGAAAALARAGLRPLALDVGFLEVPLSNRAGVLVAPDADPGERAAIERAVVGAARECARVGLFVVKHEPPAGGRTADAPPAMARVPFMPNAERALPFRDYAGFLASLSGNRRHHARRTARLFAQAGGVVEVHEDFDHLADTLHALYARTCADHRARGDLPVPIPLGRSFFAALPSLPRATRRVILLRVGGAAAAFALMVRSGDGLAMKTFGMDGARARPAHAYFRAFYAAIELALAWGASRIDFGTSTFAFKEYLGARLHPTEYFVRFDRWYMQPVTHAVRWHFARQDRAAAAREPADAGGAA